jgi:hypothetical protein
MKNFSFLNLIFFINSFLDIKIRKIIEDIIKLNGLEGI